MDGSATFAMASGRLATAEATMSVASTSPALGGAVEGISAGATAAVFAAIFSILLSWWPPARGREPSDSIAAACMGSMLLLARHCEINFSGFTRMMGRFTSCSTPTTLLLAGVYTAMSTGVSDNRIFLRMGSNSSGGAVLLMKPSAPAARVVAAVWGLGDRTMTLGWNSRRCRSLTS